MEKIKKIEHEGTIVEIDKDTISVEIINKSACATCHAKGVCTASEESVKIIEIPYTISSLAVDYAVGERVNVLLEASLGMSAVFFAYVFPLLILVAGILILPVVGLTELLTGLVSIISIVVYYIILSLFRNKLERIYSFSIEKISK